MDGNPRAGVNMAPLLLLKKLIMENNAPFEIGQRVICIKDNWANHYEFSTSEIKKGGVYTVTHIEYIMWTSEWYIKLVEEPDNTKNYLAKKFAPINPYSNSAIKELAEEAVKERIEIDVPIRKEVETKP